MRVVVADDSVLLREGIVMLLEDAGLEVVGQAGDAEDLVRKVGAHKPDVAVVDVRMPPGNSDDGLRAAILLRSRQPDLGVLVLSQYVEPAYAQALLADTAEGVGYLLKDRIGDVDGSSRRSSAWRAAARRSTPRSCAPDGQAARPGRRSTSSPPASARRSS